MSKKVIYRKLQDYILNEKNVVHVIFGDLTSMDCEYNYKDITYIPRGIYAGEYDYLLDKKVCSIRPSYKIEKNQIIPYLKIWLKD